MFLQWCIHKAFANWYIVSVCRLWCFLFVTYDHRTVRLASNGNFLWVLSSNMNLGGVHRTSLLSVRPIINVLLLIKSLFLLLGFWYRIRCFWRTFWPFAGLVYNFFCCSRWYRNCFDNLILGISHLIILMLIMIWRMIVVIWVKVDFWFQIFLIDFVPLHCI